MESWPYWFLTVNTNAPTLKQPAKSGIIPIRERDGYRRSGSWPWLLLFAEAEVGMRPATLEIQTILLCDDERGIRRLVRTLLIRQGYQVLEAQNGKHALEVAESHQGTIHLLLTDVMMPELKGPHLAEQLRAVRPDVRVIFMSADFTDGLLASVDGCPLIQKPFDRSTLLEAVGDSLAQPPHPLCRKV
jgi:CheY-like chemotaxis protein